MGYNTAVSFLNDGVDLLRKKEYQEKFCNDLYDAIISGKKEVTISIANFCNPVTVKRTHHADDLQMYIHGHNSMMDHYEIMDYFNRMTAPNWDKSYCPKPTMYFVKRACQDLLKNIKENEKRFKAELAKAKAEAKKKK